MKEDSVSRRDFLKSCALGSATVLLASCTTGKVSHLPYSTYPKTGGMKIPSSTGKNLVHVVRSSETMWYLSKAYNVPIETIYKMNNLRPGSTLQVGQKLVIPVVKVKLTSPVLDPSEVLSPPTLHPVTTPQTFITPLSLPINSRRTIHEVGPLETVWRISRMYDVDANAIYRANQLRPGSPIHVGQKLVIPNAKVFHNVIPLYPNRKWKYVLVHHTATEIGNATLINRNHHHRGFWHGLGYHFLIDNGTLGKGDGQIEASPRWIKQQDGAHCKAGGMNSVGIGIGLVGNFSEVLPTPNQMRSLIYLSKTLNQCYDIRSTHVLPHRDVFGARTECPGNRFPWSTVETYVCRS